jgi:hypothetical protein
VPTLPIFTYGSMTGLDNHLLRDFTTDQQGTGQGVQLEAILSYSVTDYFSVGAGGRYWAMWTTSATSTPNISGAASQRSKFSTERYGALLKATFNSRLRILNH